MKIKTIVFLTCFILALFCSGIKPINAGSGAAGNTAKVTKTTKSTEITYVRVLIDGVWWIFVYQDGSLINVYPDEDE